MTATRSVTKREFAAEAIQNAIQNGFFRPGEVVSQRRISEELHLSVTPIREAIIALSATGLIEQHSHQSIRVKQVDAKRLSDIYHVRLMLELDAVSSALPYIGKTTIDDIKRINLELKRMIKSTKLDEINALDRKFHYLVFRQSHNEALVSCIEFIKSSFSFYSLWSHADRLKLSVSEHAEFITALEQGDRNRCLDAHRRHLASGLRAALEFATVKDELRAAD